MTEKQKVGWKVIRESRHSFMLWGSSGERLYKKRVKVVPAENCGPLCVFRDKYMAWAFSKGLGNKTVLKCLYKPSKIRRVWSARGSCELGELPNGTALADSVTCLE